MDPIQRDDFNVHRGREANPERMKRIACLAQRKERYTKRLETHIREAILTGHSYRQVANAAGVSVTKIQRIVQKEKVENK